MVIYLDSSALVKLVTREAESAALRRFLRRGAVRVSSALARVEVPRAVRTHGAEALALAQAMLSRIQLLRVDDEVLAAAAAMDPGVLRTLDAIHLASAQVFAAELDSIVTYDVRMAHAAAMLGFRTVAPA